MERLKDRPIQKRYYKIGEISELVGVAKSTIRHWEIEFKEIRPHRKKMVRNGHRIYTNKDLLVIQYIKDLLWDQGYTIRGAKMRLQKDLNKSGSWKAMLEKEVSHV